MYSQDLELLISAFIEGGGLSEKKKEVILKKGEAEGIDRDELELYIDAKIMQKGKANSLTEKKHSIEVLREKLQLATQEGEEIKRKKGAFKNFFSIEDPVDIARCKVLRFFNVPTEHDDLLEFTIAVKSDKNNEKGVNAQQAYNELYSACLQTIRAHYNDDPAFAAILKNANWKAGLKAFNDFFKS